MNRLYATSLVFGLLAMGTLAGCGAAPYSGVDPSAYNTTSYTASAYTDTTPPYGAATAPYGSTTTPPVTGYDPTTGQPVYGQAVPVTYVPSPVISTQVSPAHTGTLTTSSASANGLVATITGIDHTGIFGLGHVTVHVEVSNPTRSTLSGRLSVQFTNGGEPTGSLDSEKLTLTAGQTKNLIFTSSAWKVNSAEADIEADPAFGAQSTVSNAP